jgi:prolipoprotein diacylglyceryltransferase
VLGRYLLGAGALRFAVEFLRVNERVAFGLSVAHIVSLVAIAAAVVTLVVARRTPQRRDPRHR